MDSYQGIVAFYDDAEGYGMIELEEEEDLIFFNKSDVEGDVKEGDCVSFELVILEDNPDTDYAANIRLCE